ncbi:MAG: response regulator [Odoribacter sp.]|nr:response regulator [Odoribacter sp.]
MKKTLWLLFILLNGIVVYADFENSLFFKQINTEDGLSQNTVRTVLCDKQGFIWAGTLDGLNRYDGKNFIIHKPRIGDVSSLPDYRINSLSEDQHGNIWVRMYNNTFHCYNPKTESFIPVYDNDTIINLSYTAYHQTQDGHIWLWNRQGGIRITHSNEKLTTDFELHSLRDKFGQWGIRFLTSDKNNDTWIGSDGSLFRIGSDLTTDEYFPEENINFIKAIPADNKIYFITRHSGIYVYDTESRNFTDSIPLDPSLLILNAALIDREQILFTVRRNSIKIFNLTTCKFESGIHMPDIPGEAQLFTDRKGGIWIYNHSGMMWHYQNEKETFRQLHLIPEETIAVIDFERYNVFIDSRDIYWITTYGNGLFKYNPINGDLQHYAYQPTKNSPASDFLLSITEDPAGNLWIGSEYGGMIKVSEEDYAFKFLRPEPEISIGKSNNVRVVFEDSKGNIWIGTKNGSLYIYDNDLQNGKCVSQHLNPYTIIEDHRKRIWVGTKGDGVYLFDINNHSIISHYRRNPSNPNSLSNNSVFYIMKDRDNRIWIGTFGGGINLVEEKNNRITFKHFFSDQDNIRLIRHMIQDKQGRIWAGSYAGLIRFNPEKLEQDKEAYRLFAFDVQDSEGLYCNDVKTLFEDKEGTIWVGTGGGGLSRYWETPRGEEYFTTYMKQHGLPGDVINSITQSEDGMLWIACESGLAQLDCKEMSFMIHRFSERPQGQCFNDNSVLRRSNGEILLGTLDGLLVFNPQMLKKNDYIPSVVFTDFSIFDQRIEPNSHTSPLTQSITYTNKLTLSHKENTFTLGFACLNLTEPEQNRYTYILEPYDKYWSSATNNTQATYKNLPPGKYTFKVKGSNPDGEWNETESQLQIIVKPPFWQSGIAYAVYTLLILLALWIALKLINKFNKLNNAVKIEKQLTDFKLRFFTNISHEFRTPLTLIRGAVESLSKQESLTSVSQTQVKSLERHTRQMMRLIDQLLEFRKIQNNIHTLNLELTDIKKFTEEIFQAFNETAIQKQINYQFICDFIIPEIYIDRGKVDKILFNLLSNAFKYTPAGGEIELIINYTIDDNITLTVKDNGCGIPKEKQHLIFSRFMQINFSAEGTGVGLSLVKEFTETHKGKVWYEENSGQGSIFKVQLPVNPAIYEGENFINADKSTSSERIEKVNIDNENTIIELPEIEPRVLAECKILVIDDNPDILNYLSQELGKHFVIETAEDGKKGLEKAIELNPDLIICDVMMPYMDGFEVTRRLKSEFQTSHIPLIILTAHSSPEHQLEGIESGADSYISKPFSLKYLLFRIYKLIEQREKLKKRFSMKLPEDEKLLSNTEKDREFYELITKILEENLNNPTFSVDEFSEKAGLRRTIFYKKVKGLTGFTPNDLIKIKRMKKAAELLATGKYTVSEVSWQVGLEDPFYFSKCFKAQFGCSPSKYKSAH